MSWLDRSMIKQSLIVLKCFPFWISIITKWSFVFRRENTFCVLKRGYSRPRAQPKSSGIFNTKIWDSVLFWVLLSKTNFLKLKKGTHHYCYIHSGKLQYITRANTKNEHAKHYTDHFIYPKNSQAYDDTWTSASII